MENKTEISVKEAENGWIVTTNDITYIYHTWPEVVQFLSEFFDECDDSPAVEPAGQRTDPILRGYSNDPFYPSGRGF